SEAASRLRGSARGADCCGMSPSLDGAGGVTVLAASPAFSCGIWMVSQKLRVSLFVFRGTGKGRNPSHKFGMFPPILANQKRLEIRKVKATPNMIWLGQIE